MQSTKSLETGQTRIGKHREATELDYGEPVMATTTMEAAATMLRAPTCTRPEGG